MSRMRSWSPLFEGNSAAEVWTAIDDIAQALRLPETGATSPFLADGDAGIALFFSYLAEARSGEDESGHAFSLLDRAVERLESEAMPHGLFGGFTGIAWTVEHLSGRLFEVEENEENPNRQIDEILLHLLQQPPRPGDYDLISGLAGLGVYAREALPRPTARECLDLVLRRLEEMAEERPEGLAWFTPPELMPDYQRAQYPTGYFNLGVAHGIPGVVGLLGALCLDGTAPARARILLDRTAAWLLAQEAEEGAEFRFPYWIADDAETPSSRLAWCYGDPGVAATLLLAARGASDPALEKAALRIGLSAADRPPERAGIVDAGLCHGAAGLGHLFNRLFQATGEERLAEAARFWMRSALELRRPGQGVAGFLSYEGQGTGESSGWQASHGFLTGAAGVGLALLGAVSPVEPEWDRVLLTAIPPGG